MTSDSPVPVRQVEHEHLDAGQREHERPDPVRVRPVAATDEQRALVEPERVAALRGRRRLEPREHGYARAHEIPLHRRGLAAPALLARAQQQRAAVGDDRRIVGVDRIRIARQRLGEDDLGTGAGEQLAERLVLARDRGRIGLGVPAVRAPVRARGCARGPHEHAPQRLGHRLAAERRAHRPLSHASAIIPAHHWGRP